MAQKSKDWKALFVKFRQSQERTGISLKKWCEKNDLAYNSARRSFNQIKKDVIASVDQQAESDHSNYDHVPSIPEPTVAAAKKPKQGKQPKNKGGAPKGNTNAVLHGLFSKRFGKAWELAQYYDWETRYQVLQAQSLQCEMFALEYREAVEAIETEIEAEERAPTDDEYDRIIKLQDKIERCGQASRHIIDQIDRLDTNVLGREYTAISSKKAAADIALKRAAMRKTIADAVHRERENKEHGTDTKIKTLQGDLLQANILKAKREAELKEAQIKQLDVESNTDFDGMDLELEEIFNSSQDEILERYKNAGGVVHD